MCWPVDRPATHAAAGAAARGALIFCFGGFFHTLRSGWHERVRGGGFNPLRGATTGVVMRRRATSGEMARGGLVFVFSLEVAPVSEGDSFICSGVVRHACRHRVTARGVFVLGDCFTCSGATRRGLMRFLVLWGGAVVVCSEGGCGSMCWPVDRPATHAAAGAAARGALIFLFWGVLSHAREWMAREG